jgi:hypothetical protein
VIIYNFQFIYLMKRLVVAGLLITTTLFVCGQNIDAIINTKEAYRIEKFLSSDELRGRRAFTPEIDKAADFIAAEFKAIGLQTLNNSGGYRQEFVMITASLLNASCTFNKQKVDINNIVVVTCQPELHVTEKSGYEKVKINAGQNFIAEARKLVKAGKNYMVLVDTSFSKNFKRLTRFNQGVFKTDKSVIFVLTVNDPTEFTIDAQHKIVENKLANVVGILPGKSLPAGQAGKKNEYVIFSGHYDHVGTGSPVEAYPHDNKDSIYNGANDDAAGTTAVIMLAKYFKELNNNERTIVFVAFTAEELGGFGSQYFSKQLDPAAVVAMFNIEMIGTESKWGKNSAYITGYDKTDMGVILQKNLEGTGFTFYPDPYIQQQLFYRSDNATLARQGVPAHTISTSKMDNEPNYHKVSDQIETLDMENMVMIIKSIALSSKGIIAGKETPTRVKVEELRQ